MKEIASIDTFGQLFILPSYNIELLPKILQDRCLKEDQRSPEWKELMLFYQCGNSTVLEKPPINICWVEYYYNLIRRCIIESLIINNTDFKEIMGVSVKKVSIGLIVKQRDVKNFPGCAPDLILITEDSEIIPVEIKSIISKPINNKDYRRDKHLATLQIEKAIELINLENCKKGLIIFVYIYQDQDQVIFDSQCTFYCMN